jgi:hypothetical protein
MRERQCGCGAAGGRAAGGDGVGDGDGGQQGLVDRGGVLTTAPAGCSALSAG